MLDCKFIYFFTNFSLFPPLDVESLPLALYLQEMVKKMAVTRVFACQLLWVRTLKARFFRALYVRPIMGRSRQTLKTDLRDPVFRSRSMWCYVRFDTARSQQSCQIRIKTPACCVGTKWFTDIRNESRSRAPSGVLQSWVYLTRKFCVCVQTAGCRSVVDPAWYVLGK